jgi:hypothetical protein
MIAARPIILICLPFENSGRWPLKTSVLMGSSNARLGEVERQMMGSHWMKLMAQFNFPFTGGPDPALVARPKQCGGWDGEA